MSVVASPVRLIRAGLRLVMDSTDPVAERAFTEALQYDRRERGEDGRPITVRKICYARDKKGRLYSTSGFAERVARALRQYGRVAELVVRDRHDPTRFETDWAALRDTGFKPLHKQDLCLAIMAKMHNGQIKCPPGWGKGTIIAALCVALPNARIAVISKNQAVLVGRLYPEIAAAVPGVGLFYAGSKRRGVRVNCYTTGTLTHADFSATDLVIVDEGHQAATDYACNFLARFLFARMFTLSASLGDRWDGGDFRLEGLFGPVRLDVSYQEAQAHNMVAPVKVFWKQVVTDENPVENDKGGTAAFKRHAYWSNHVRNQCIADDANLYDDDTQILIFCHTLQHALRLKALLPNFYIVYKPGRPSSYMAQRLLDASGLPPMTGERYQKLKTAFERGWVKKAIVTTCWNVGVNFIGLQVLIRADGGDSRVDDLQVPGRAVRWPKAIREEKPYAIIHEYCDGFDPRSCARAQSRSIAYDKYGWEQQLPAGAFDNALRR